MRHVTRAAAVGAVLALLFLVTACAPPAEWPVGSGKVPQAPPLFANGLGVSADGSVWVADLLGGQLVAADPDTGTITRRNGPWEGQDAPDDVAFLDDGSVLSTGYLDGTLDQLRPDGTATVVEQVPGDANPVTVADDGTVYVGTENGGALYEADLDPTTPLEVLATGQPELNGFDVGPDGDVYFPIRSVSSTLPGRFCAALGIPCPSELLGKIRRYDPDTGTVTTVADGLSGPAALKFDGNGVLHVVEATDPPRVATVDVGTGDVTTLAELPPGFVDNLAFAADGRIFVSRFFGPELAVVHPEGTVDTLHVGS